MSTRPKILDLMVDIPGDAVDQALLAGLLEVDAPTQIEIVRTLILRGHDAGLQGLPPLFFKLTPAAQTQITAQAARMFGALRACVCSSSPQTRQNTLEIVRRSCNPRLAYLATHAIHDGAQKIRSEAAIALLELTKAHFDARAEMLESLALTSENSPELLKVVSETIRVHADEHKFLLVALKDAVEHYESHHRPEVVEAAMLLADELELSLFDQATIKRGKLTHAMIEILGAELDARFVPFIYVALAHPEMRRRIVPRISTCRSREFFIEFIRHAWMARDRNIAKNLLYVRNIEWLEDGFEAVFTVPSDVAIKMPAWLLELGLPANQKVALLLNCLIVDNPAANRAAVWALVAIDTPAGTAALESLLDHENEAIRTIARHEVNRRNRATRSIRRRTDVRGRPSEWLTLLDRANLKEDFDDFWQNFEHIHAENAQAAGHHALKFISGFATQMQLKLLSQNPADRFRAIRLAVAMALCRHFEKEIFAASNDPLPEIRSAAMSALGQIGGETSRRILERAVNDADDSVVAASISSLDQMGARRREDLIMPKVESDSPDVRGAAVRSLLRLRVPASATALIQMLHDPRPDHRCAALWIVDQLRLATLAPRILSIAQSDPDPRIARVAMHVARRIHRGPLPPSDGTMSKNATGGSTAPDEATLNAGAASC